MKRQQALKWISLLFSLLFFLEKNANKIDAFLKNNEKCIGRRGKEVKSNVTDNKSAKMKTSHGTIQGYTGIATVDEQNLNAIDPKTKETPLKNIKLLADSGYHSKSNLNHLANESIDTYIANNKFRNRDPRFADADKYKPKKKKGEKFKNTDFIYSEKNKTCVCPAGKELWLKNKKTTIGDGIYAAFQGYLSDCKNCGLKNECLKKPDNTKGRHPHPKNDSDQGRHLYSKRLGIVDARIR